MRLNYYSAMNDSSSGRQQDIIVGSRSSPELERLRSLARLLDTALPVPGTRYRFGLDPIIGLVPFIGDAIGALFSVYIVFQAGRLGVSKSTLVRMIANVGVDTLIGEIPLLGDLFDFGFKSNTRNLALLEHHLHRPGDARAQSRRVLALLAAGLVALVVGIVALGIVVAEYILRSLA
jgi:uncharacterized protein DUF4112